MGRRTMLRHLVCFGFGLLALILGTVYERLDEDKVGPFAMSSRHTFVQDRVWVAVAVAELEAEC